MVKLFLKNSNLCDHNSLTSQTDRQTDRQTACDRNTALCTKVHRAVKTGTFYGVPILSKRKVCEVRDRQTDRQKRNISDGEISDDICRIGCWITLFLVWRKSIHFWRRWARKKTFTVSFLTTLSFLTFWTSHLLPQLSSVVSTKLRIFWLSYFKKSEARDRRTDWRVATLNEAS